MVKRRQFMRYLQAGLIASLGTGIAARWQPTPAQSSGSLRIQWLGHTCFLFTGNDGVKVLANPFRPGGCTANYRPPQVANDVVMVSSSLLDEGAWRDLKIQHANVLVDPGGYTAKGLKFQGISTLHDRVNGYRFGRNVAWKWTQGGVNILHLGGIASPIGLEEKIAMGQPDVLLIPVGGSAKAYTPEEAKAAIETLAPKVVIPTHYKTDQADTESCKLQGLEDFLTVMTDAKVQRLGKNQLSLRSGSLPSEGLVIDVFSYS